MAAVPANLRRRLLSAGVLVALLGCDQPPRSEEKGTAQAPERGGTAVVAFNAEPGHVIGLLERTDADTWLGALVGASLATQQRDSAGTVWLGSDRSASAVASRWTYASPDSTALRFELRPDARWSDGRPITARDVVFTLGLLRDTALASPHFDPSLHFDSAVARGEREVSVYFGRRTPRMMDLAGISLLPEHVFRGVPAARLEQHPAAREPARMVTAGPFRVAQWRRGDRITLSANPHSPALPHLDQLVIRIIPEATTLAAELERGEVDFAMVAPQEAARLRRRVPGLTIQSQPGRQYDFIGYHPGAHPALADPRVRRALGQAIDVRALIRGLDLEGYATPAAGPFTPMFPELSSGQEPLRYDTAAARRTLDELGWRDADGDGLRERGGRPLRLELVTNAESQRRADAAVIIQGYWRAVGVESRLQRLELNTLFGRLQEREYQAGLFGWVVPPSPDLAPVFAPGGPVNFVDYADTVAARAIEAAGAAPTAAAAAPLWRAAAARIVADQPYTFLYHIDQPYAVSGRLRGVRVGVVSPYSNAAEWWIPRALQRRGAARPDTGRANSAAGAPDSAGEGP